MGQDIAQPTLAPPPTGADAAAPPGGALAGTPLAALRAALAPAGAGFAVDVPSDWLQGRTAFGGLTSTLCVDAAARAHPDLPALRSAQFSFLAPATGRLTVTPRLLRQGKSTAFVAVELEGEDGLAVRATLAYGAARPSTVLHAGLPRAAAPSPDGCEPFQPAGQTFGAHFDRRFASPSRPFTPGGEPRLVMWMRHADDPGPEATAALLALADAIPAAATVLYPKRGRLSTMTWSVEFIGEPPPDGEGWTLLDCASEHLRDGYGIHTSTLWREDGAPLLVSRQTVAIFD